MVLKRVYNLENSGDQTHPIVNIMDPSTMNVYPNRLIARPRIFIYFIIFIII